MVQDGFPHISTLKKEYVFDAEEQSMKNYFNRNLIT